jgi:hypothetical protein
MCTRARDCRALRVGGLVHEANADVRGVSPSRHCRRRLPKRDLVLVRAADEMIELDGPGQATSTPLQYVQAAIECRHVRIYADGAGESSGELCGRTVERWRFFALALHAAYTSMRHWRAEGIYDD